MVKQSHPLTTFSKESSPYAVTGQALHTTAQRLRHVLNITKQETKKQTKQRRAGSLQRWTPSHSPRGSSVMIEIDYFCMSLCIALYGALVNGKCNHLHSLSDVKEQLRIELAFSSKRETTIFIRFSAQNKTIVSLNNQQLSVGWEHF